MEKLDSALAFNLMAVALKLRDAVSPRIRILEVAGIHPGDRVLDFGCGPGSYLLPLLTLTGREGRVFALDMHPLAIKSVEQIIRKRGLHSVTPILSRCRTGLDEKSIDVALLYDVYHALHEPAAVLNEIHRVLKPGGILSFSDHHMKEREIEERFRENSPFHIKGRTGNVYSLVKKHGILPG